MSADQELCRNCFTNKASANSSFCVSCAKAIDRQIPALLKEIADKHFPKVVRPTQEPLYEKRG